LNSENGHGGEVADEPKSGTVWQPDELDLIVAGYFAMLAEEAAGRTYLKIRVNERLQTELGRSHASVEFKLCNISAVLDNLALPTIEGYRPRLHIQKALYGAVERYLDQRPELASTGDLAPPSWEPALAEAAAMFEHPAPQPSDTVWTRDPGMHRLVRKFNPGARDARNRALGKAGEALAFRCEQDRLRAAGRADLARRVRWVAEEDGDGAGYDILSFNAQGAERLLEVKTTCGSRTTPFLITRNEYDLSIERSAEFRIFRIHDCRATPAYFRLRPPLDQAALLSTDVYRASFAGLSDLEHGVQFARPSSRYQR
jgi:hypothetical protein